MTYHGRGAFELSEAEDGGCCVVEDVQEGYSDGGQLCYSNSLAASSPRGFFLRTRKTVSTSSMYLM